MFVGPELPHLVRAFGGLRIVPLNDSGPTLALPEGVIVDRSLASGWRRLRLVHYVTAPHWPGFWAELWRAGRFGGWVGVARAWRWSAIARAVWVWMQMRLPDDTPLLLYTYWRGGQTLAAVRWARCHPGSVAVTRVHRYELYEDAFSPPFQPWVGVYAGLTRVFAIAQHGASYLRARGVATSKIRVMRLGVGAPRERSQPSNDGVLRVVSCSYVTPVKRVDLVARALAILAQRHPPRDIEWVHFGDGSAMPALRALVKQGPTNLKVTLPGWVSNHDVLAHYGAHPVDVLVQLSASEGLPVTIQEALAYGIPVVATDVGGVSEAVPACGDNGILIPHDAELTTVADALERIWIAPPEVVTSRRESAFLRWAKCFDAERNHRALADELAGLESESRWT